MSLELPYGVKVLNPEPVDAKYLNGSAVYTGITQANSLIPQAIRHIGLTVNINNDEYWYASGTTDGDLVLKFSSSGSTISSVANIGSGTGVYKQVTSSGELQLKSLSGGTNIGVSQSGDTIVIAQTGQTPSNVVNVEIANSNTGFTATTSSYLISVYNEVDIYLPPIPLTGQVIIVADAEGDAGGGSAYEITIYGNGNNIGGDTTAVINTDYGSVHLIFDGTKWVSISNI